MYFPLSPVSLFSRQCFISITLVLKTSENHCFLMSSGGVEMELLSEMAQTH